MDPGIIAEKLSICRNPPVKLMTIVASGFCVLNDGSFTNNIYTEFLLWLIWVNPEWRDSFENFWFFVGTDQSLKIYTQTMNSDKTCGEFPPSGTQQEGGFVGGFYCISEI